MRMLSIGRRRDAEDCLRHLGPAGSNKPRHADDLTATNREGDVAKNPASAQAS